jgi:hypothetical protein
MLDSETVKLEINKKKKMVLKKYEIKWKEGSKTIEAENIEESIKKFKELRIDIPDKEISILSFGRWFKISVRFW